MSSTTGRDDALIRALYASHGAALRLYVQRLLGGDQTVVQIAVAQNIPAGTVRSRLFYALRALRLSLQERGGAVAMRCARTESIGAYLLGALDGDEACQLQAHLAQCRACTQDFDQLAMLPSLLRWLEPGDIERLCPDRDPAACATPSRRLPRTPALAAAVLVAVALTAVLLASVGSRRDAPHARDLTFTKTDAASHVRATLRAAPRTWGTQLHLWLSGPLYTFSLDRHAGEASGNRFSDQFGGTRFTWLAATPTGTAAAGGAAGTTPASTAPDYPNY